MYWIYSLGNRRHAFAGSGDARRTLPSPYDLPARARKLSQSGPWASAGTSERACSAWVRARLRGLAPALAPIVHRLGVNFALEVFVPGMAHADNAEPGSGLPRELRPVGRITNPNRWRPAAHRPCPRVPLEEEKKGAIHELDGENQESRRPH